MEIDYTTSNVGQQYLYHRLRSLPINSEQEKAHHEEIIKQFEEDEKLRNDVKKELKRLGEYSSYRYFSVLPFIALGSILLSFIYPMMFLVTLALFLIHFVIHFINKNNINKYVRSIPQLIKLTDVAKKLNKQKAFTVLNPDIEESISTLKKVSKQSYLFNIEARLQGELQSIIWSAFELIKILFLLEPLAFFKLMDLLTTKKTEIEEVFEFVGRIDTLLSIQTWRSTLDTYCIPWIHQSGSSIKIQDMKHPLIDDCITNSINLTDQSILLTGSNMSGKTTFIRTIGINVVIGRSLNTCTAKSLTMPYLNLYSSIRISDDLIHQKSYYLEEVKTVKTMIEKANSEEINLILMDELFKGTNTIERIAAGKAILTYLAQKNNYVIISTHDIELTYLLDNEYKLYHFSESITDQKLDFDYKLKEGRLTQKNAINILKMNEYPEEIISEAIKISKSLEED